MARLSFRIPALLASLVLVATGACARSQPPARAAGASKTLRLTFLSLDHGRATLMEVPGGTAGLIGAGGPGDGPQIVRFLKQRGIQTLQVLVVGTWKEEYVGGAAEIMKGIKIQRVMHNQIFAHTKHGDPFLHAAEDLENAGKMVVTPAIPNFTQYTSYNPACSIHVVAPTGPMTKTFEKEPDCSTVLQIFYSHVSFLDLGESAVRHQKVWWKAVEPQPTGEILSIGRNGAADALDASLLKPLKTRIAILPIPRKSGKNPAPATLAALKRAGVRVYRTDRDGTIVVTTDGSKINVKTKV